MGTSGYAGLVRVWEMYADIPYDWDYYAPHSPTQLTSSRNDINELHPPTNLWPFHAHRFGTTGAAGAADATTTARFGLLSVSDQAGEQAEVHGGPKLRLHRERHICRRLGAGWLPRAVHRSLECASYGVHKATCPCNIA